MRVALLTNFIPPYRKPLLEALRDKFGELRVFISTPMERNRRWRVEHGTLDVVRQRGVTIRRTYPTAEGFELDTEIHLPYDTIVQLLHYCPDVVISGQLGAASLQAALYRSLRRDIPLLIWVTLSERSEEVFGRTRTLVRRFILARADRVLVNGESGARYIKRFGVLDSRISRIPYSVETDRFARVKSERPAEACCRLLHVGSLIKRKGVGPFLHVLAAWAADYPLHPVELCWLGDGEMRAALSAFACPPNLKQIFYGDVPYEDLPAYYAKGDILVQPTLLDEWGLTVPEGMAAGLPVLGSIQSQAVEELVTEGSNGWTFDPLRDGSTRQALERMFATPPDRLVEMRALARRSVTHLTPTSTAEKFAHAVDDVLQQQRNQV